MDFGKLIEEELKKDVKRETDTEEKNAITYEKYDILATVSISKNSNIEISLVSWNGRKPKYEIRKWNKDGTAGKGITLTKDQLIQLIEVMKNIELN